MTFGNPRELYRTWWGDQHMKINRLTKPDMSKTKRRRKRKTARKARKGNR